MSERLEHYCKSIADGDHQAPPKSESGIPFITISCLSPNGNGIDYGDVAHVPFEYYESLPSKRKAQPGMYYCQSSVA